LLVLIKSRGKNINFNKKLSAMKKIILHSLFYIACFASITSCSKSVKAPAKKSAATTNTTTTNTTTQTQNQQGHTCGGGGSSTSTYAGGSH
jgi:hypothetical protein